jgi:hypothetical protein
VPSAAGLKPLKLAGFGGGIGRGRLLDATDDVDATDAERAKADGVPGNAA